MKKENPIKIRMSEFIKMAKKIKETPVLKLAYADEIHRRVIGPVAKSKLIDSWIIIKNDDQITAILEILQDKGILSKSKKLVLIPSK